MGDRKFFETRRDFIALAAAFTAGAFLPREVAAAVRAESDGLPRAISIIGVIDVTQSLADGSLANNAYWFDNNARGGSSNLGTGNLVSVIAPGAAISWCVWSMEVETSVDMAGVSGPGAIVSNAAKMSLYDGTFIYWTGRVDASAAGRYTYDIALDVSGQTMIGPSSLSLDVR